MKKPSLTFSLFKSSFFLVFILYLLTLIILNTILILKESYKTSLENEFATKQPHIKITYINSNLKDISKDLKLIKKIPLVKAITPFSEGEEFFESIGYKKTGANSLYNGNIKIIGILTDSFVYDFFDMKFLPFGDFQVPLTVVEFIYKFRTTPNLIIFNQTLFKSYFPVIESTEDFSFKNKHSLNGKLCGVFNDFSNSPTIYTNLYFANRLLNKPLNHADGFFVNATSIKKIDALLENLKKILPKNRFIIHSWLELRKKQFDMFYLFSMLSLIIITAIFLLSLLFAVLIIYHSIVKKSYQLSVLFTLGYNLKKEIMCIISVIISIATIINFYTVSNLTPKILKTLNLPTSNTLKTAFYATCFLDLFFITVSFFIIKTTYELKAKSVF
ncbi:MAG: hypothetical protein ABGX26_03850 [Nautiliaceae bacterium]